MLIKDLIQDIRFKIQDEDEVSINDREILNAINQAVRFIRGIYIDEIPYAVANELNGNIAANKNDIQLITEPIKILSVRCDGKALSYTSIKEIEDTKRQGEPRFYTLGKKTIKVFPIPNQNVSYEILYIEPTVDLIYTDVITFPNDFVDYITEFAALRLNMVEQYDVSMDSQVFAEFRNKVTMQIHNKIEGINFIEGYY